MYNVSISTDNLSVGYPQKNNSAQSRRTVQSNLNLTFCQGELVALLGPNGSGKSTLLRTLAGLQPPISGTCNLFSLTPHQLSQQLALVLTENNSVENTSVHDIIAMGRYPYTSFLGGLSEQDEQIICDALQLVSHFDTDTPNTQNPSDTDNDITLDRMFNSLSDGEKQRVLIAKAIAQQTPVILLDEPTSHLDLPSRIHTFRLLRQLAHTQNKTILISTHELDLSLQVADRVLLLSKTNSKPHSQQPTYRLDSVPKLIADNAFTTAFGMDVLSAFKSIDRLFR